MLIFLIFVLATYIIGSPVCATCFEMSPKDDMYISQGEDLKFNCSLKATDNTSDCNGGHNITNIRIRKGDKFVSSEMIVYHVADKTVMTTIRNATFGDDGVYYCLNGDSSAIQARLRVHVGESPGAAENLICLSRNMDDLICHFNLSKQKVKNLTEWRMEVRMYSQDWITIPSSNCDRSNCTCWLDSRSKRPTLLTFQPTSAYTIRVVVWNVTTSITIKKTTSIAKPNTVENFSYLFVPGSRNVTLSWTSPKIMSQFKMSLDYKIVITSDWATRIRLFRNRTVESEKYTLEDLIPFTNYTVTVQARSSDADSDIYWSNAGAVEFVTQSAASAHTVTMEAGSYIALNCGELEMCLVIYWRNPERRYWYGTITGYEVTVKEYQPCTDQTCHTFVEKTPKHGHFSSVKPSASVITGMAVYGTLKTNIRKEEYYQLQTKLINTEGVSRNYSEILIPNWETRLALKLEWVIVEITKSSVFISWYMDPQYCSAVTSVTYYWCIHNTSQGSYVSCLEGFDWTTFSLTDGCGTRNGHYLRNPLAMPNLKYAVSVKTPNVSGGLKWEKFRFQNDHVPESPVYSVSVDGTSLNVHIHYRDYHQSEGGKPENYTVIWKECVTEAVCESDFFNETSRTFSADFLNPVYIIDNLQPGTLYEVQVASLNSFGSSKYGEPVMVTVVTGYTVPVVEIASGTLTGVLALALIVFLCCFGRNRYRKFREKVRIVIPETTLAITKERNESREENKRMLSNDSACGSECLDSEESRNRLQKSDTARAMLDMAIPPPSALSMTKKLDVRGMEYVKAGPDRIVSPTSDTVADQMEMRIMNQEPSMQIETEDGEEHFDPGSKAPVANDTV